MSDVWFGFIVRGRYARCVVVEAETVDLLQDVVVREPVRCLAVAPTQWHVEYLGIG